jgi:PncC family amidohydrolase
VAESCTGGLVATTLTELPGSSDVFRGGVVAYSNDAKMELVGVPVEAIAQSGAVSGEVAGLLAEGAARVFRADVGVGVTGIAGPGAEGEKPAGLTYIGAHHSGRTEVREYQWEGDRAQNREASVVAALALAAEILP